MGIILFLLVFMSNIPALGADPQEAENIQAARKLFDRYVALSRAFDPSVADLYADDATIQNARTFPDGRQRTLTMPATQYKELIRKSMSSAKAREDTNEYRDIKLMAEGKNVRITATRHSNRKNYDSPLSILVAKSSDGQWKILEEISESRP
jgi:ketosteroid isomerase-like protein